MLPKIQKILFATGLGPATPYVFRYALSIAQQYQAPIAIVHGMEPLSPFAQSLVELHISHERSEEMHRQATEKVKENIEKRLALFCEKELCSDPDGRSRVCSIRVRDGIPSQVILQEAREVGADLIVMGSHRHTVLGDAMLGTTTHKVLHSTSLPVLVVRIPDGYQEEGF